MNLVELIECGQWLVETCHCGLKIGDQVKVDGASSRGIVVGRKGRRLIIQYRDFRGGVGYRNGYRIERDQSFVHKLSDAPGEISKRIGDN